MATDPMQSPIQLTASLTLTDGQRKGVSDMDAIKNPFGTAMLIDEVIFQIPTLAVATGAYLYVQLNLGHIPLTNSFVPIWSLCRLQDPQSDGYYDSYSIGGQLGVGVYVWRFDQPLYVPPNEQLTPIFWSEPVGSSGLPSTGTFNVTVTYRGRSLGQNAPRPATIQVPWASAFVGTTQTASGSYTESTTEDHLRNAFNVPMNVSRIIGRLFCVGHNSNGDVFGDVDVEAGYGAQAVTVKVTGPQGEALVRDSTPWSQVFTFLSRSWEVHSQLEPRGFYLVDIAEDLTTNPSGTIIVRPYISIIGSREEVTP